ISTIKKVLLAIPFLILTIVVFTIFLMMFEKWKTSNKSIQFITKAFKVAFIKNQFQLENNLDLILPLLNIQTFPHIPIENFIFSDRTFKKCNFYRLKNVQFKSCIFNTPVLKDCHLNNVVFEDTTFTPMIYVNCRFTLVDFIDCKFQVSDNKSNKKLLNVKEKNDNIIYFKDCEFDIHSLNNIKEYIKVHNYVIGKEISGSQKFIEMILS
uniref:pentapeptide repeat-containing protein n=1 Tax=Winogradskyella sp. 4-2091 TaxID=3381659 RepID=UPI003892AF72